MKDVIDEYATLAVTIVAVIGIISFIIYFFHGDNQLTDYIKHVLMRTV